MRSCRKCGTKFYETRNQLLKDNDVIDPIPECYKGDTENGICVNCCGCHK